MKELSLFSGAGGGLLATRHILGWNTLGYVESDAYCQRVLRARIDDDILDDAPIFGDVCEFVESGAAREYRGAVDVVSAGFPCQPFSWAGSKRGEDDGRNMWPATIAVLRAVRPRCAFLENVPGLLATPYFGTILGDLAEAGFDARWGVLGADDVGAPHLRKRLWIYCWAAQGGVPDTERGALWEQRERDGEQHLEQGPPESRDYGAQWDENPAEQAEPRVGRVVDGVAHRVDRIRALGNGQVPVVAACAWALLQRAARSS